MSAPFDFRQLSLPTPVLADVTAQYGAIRAAFDRAASPEERLAAVARWDQLVRQLESCEALVNVRFQQDTRDPVRKAARDLCDQMRPKLKELSVDFKKMLLASPHRPELAARFGPQAFALWEAQTATYAPAIDEDMVREAKLEGDYTELLASALLDFHGQKYNLSDIVKFIEDPDRQTRHEAEQVRWGWFAKQKATFDRQYDELVSLRTGMAKKLGFDSFIGLGYKRMQRIDYTQSDVEVFRREVREHVVPLCVELRRRQAARLGVEKLMWWDSAIQDVQGNPAPRGDHDWMLERAQEMFDGLGHGLDAFFRLLRETHLLDLPSRDGKAGGGFCTSLVSHGLPFVFANFNGTQHDVVVFTHEIGHAFQNYLSCRLPLLDYAWPTTESCEIHSMGLEFLSWPHMEKFFGPDADRFRRIHLEQQLQFLPYGVAVDHFQHLVYAQPKATPDERHAMWQEVERIYLPWLDYGDLPHVAAGGRWQFQRHIYLYPFYYIDYTLALTCALQLWAKSQADFPAAMDSYVALCRRGGQAPFQELVKGAGLVSPFQAGSLRDTVARARKHLGV